ncbi:MAG: hypothetical protein AAB559_00240, partial [Patescibacteria group bacterium]
WPEMLSFPYVIDKGFIIYKDFHHVYQPLLTFILLGIYKIFGFNIVALKAFTYILIAIIDFALFSTVKKLTKNNKIAIFSLTSYILLQPVFDGNMLWYDIAVILPVLLSFYLVQTNLFLSGLFVAIAFLIKQQSVLLVLPIFIYLLIIKTNVKDILKFIYGCIIPVSVLFLFLYKYNIFSDYLFWTFKFPLFYLPKIEGYAINPNSKEFFILILMGLTLVVGYILNIKKIKSIFYVLLFLLLFMVLSAFPRFSLFHLQPALAVFIIVIGYLYSFSNKYFVLFLIPLLYLWKGVLLNPIKETRFYGNNEIKFSENIKKVVENKKVYFLGPSSIYYVLSNTLPPKPWIENYVWHFETPKLQKSVINGWKIDPPRYIYWSKPKEGNWYDLATYQPKEIVEYIREKYMKINESQDVEIWKLK